MTSYTHHTHSERTSDHYTLTEPVDYRDGAYLRKITALTVWWDRTNNSPWTPSVATTIGEWPYNTSPLLSRNHPDLLNLFADLIQQTKPTDDMQQAKDKHPAYLTDLRRHWCQHGNNRHACECHIGTDHSHKAVIPGGRTGHEDGLLRMMYPDGVSL